MFYDKNISRKYLESYLWKIQKKNFQKIRESHSGRLILKRIRNVPVYTYVWIDTYVN